MNRNVWSIDRQLINYRRQSSEKTSDCTLFGVNDKITSKMVEGRVSSVDNMSQPDDNRVRCQGISWMIIRHT